MGFLTHSGCRTTAVNLATASTLGPTLLIVNDVKPSGASPLPQHVCEEALRTLCQAFTSSVMGAPQVLVLATFQHKAQLQPQQRRPPPQQPQQQPQQQPRQQPQLPQPLQPLLLPRLLQQQPHRQQPKK